LVRKGNDLLARARVPDLQGFAGNNLRAHAALVGTEEQPDELLLRPVREAKHVAGRRLGQGQDALGPDRREPPAVGTESPAGLLELSVADEAILAGPHVEDTQAPCPPRQGEEVALRGEGRVPARARVADKGVRLLSCRRVPHLDGRPTPRSKTAAVGAEADSF